ncbi:MAG TPA: HDIG domain-containing protein [Thermoanaerobaculia bacterium]|nr:HDIG domain-containing protein [Thermoanaerobaculia bacterium]
MDRDKGSPSRLQLLVDTGTANLRRRWRSRDLWRRALDTPALWVTLLLVLGTWALMPGLLFAPRATPGAIADRDYVAPRDLLFKDEAASGAKQERARADVLPVYDFDPGLTAERQRHLSQLFARGRQLLGAADDDPGAEPQEVRRRVVQELLRDEQARAGIRLTSQEAELLARRRFAPELEERLAGVIAQALRRGVVSDKALLLENRMRGISLRNLATQRENVQVDLFDYLSYPDEVRDLVEAEVRDWSGLGAAERTLLVSLLVENIPANLYLNRSETLARQEAVAAEVGQVFNQIRKGQVIVRKGDVISAADAQAISQIRGERQLRLQVPPIAATFFLLGLACLVLWLGLASERVADHSRRRIFSEALLLLLLSVLGAKFCFLVAGALSGAFEAAPLNSLRSYSYAIPFAALGLLAALLLGRNAALLLSILFSSLMSRLVVDGEPMWVVFYAFAGSLTAIYALDLYQFRQRLVIARVGLMVGTINVVMALILTALTGLGDRGPVQIMFDVVCGLAGGLLVAAAVSFALPILESLLAITTDIKLVELSNTNLPLLRRLAFEAPGTFQHSLMVANLAKEGCEAIGADTVLAYTAGLYHDVGKVLRPEYFIENQRPGRNPHDKLLPSLSALILINHVKEGLELAREHGLPRVLLDAIQQHHGTRLIKYFYHRASEQREGTGEVVEEKYRYPGPRPQNKVMGILMLADGVEAASRTLVEPTVPKIRGLIQTITDDCLREGQLDETDLTLSDLRKVSESFLRVLSNIFHHRIDYPGFDFNADPKREKRSATGAVKAS